MSWGSGLPLLADTSAWARVAHYPERWLQALDRGHIVGCGVVHLELLFSARDREDVLELDADLGTLRDLPVSRTTLAAARQAVLDLAARGSAGNHRVPPQDAIIAACAAEHGCAVLHYDAHYDRLADVLAFESVWVAPRGSL
ncbi:PIN domain-containing protein [Conexibacter sp. W3-3-2]|uniref:PIN domain-containing protein n=1 Tax=Conexibacter sp. W3-3-2 TaxID=2675227 RepID=UPI0018AA67EF|nr:PIN domain-containing protein [Conexibacter sp. W3-3-2]